MRSLISGGKQRAEGIAAPTRRAGATSEIEDFKLQIRFAPPGHRLSADWANCADFPGDADVADFTAELNLRSVRFCKLCAFASLR